MEICKLTGIIPDIQSAIKIGKDCSRIQFDIPKTDENNQLQIGEVMKLIQANSMDNIVFKITIEGVKR
ncbi:MAG: hypothetical protein GX892_09325 [Thermoanaerobacteraceae bacterium]|nr:hypothetical protein [Thermoanaerobacteraceae bacterium]